jgi:hypothetical protein
MKLVLLADGVESAFRTISRPSLVEESRGRTRLPSKFKWYSGVSYNPCSGGWRSASGSALFPVAYTRWCTIGFPRAWLCTRCSAARSAWVERSCWRRCSDQESTRNTSKLRLHSPYLENSPTGTRAIATPHAGVPIDGLEKFWYLFCVNIVFNRDHDWAVVRRRVPLQYGGHPPMSPGCQISR